MLSLRNMDEIIPHEILIFSDKNIPKWLVPVENLDPRIHNKYYSVYARDEYGRKYNESDWHLQPKDYETYNHLKRISIGKDPEQDALLYVRNEAVLVAEIARVILQKGHRRVKFQGRFVRGRVKFKKYKGMKLSDRGFVI